MLLAKTANLEPIPGYRLLEPLGKGGFGEVWKCVAPGGLFKAVKFVAGTDDAGLHQEVSNAEQELRSFNLIKTIRHPFILSVDRVESVENELVIVMELADKSLHDVLESWQNAGQPGIPRGELVGYFREAAEALDVINHEYGLQHLDIKPRNLFLVYGHIKVADFGLVSSLADLCSGTLNLGAITPLYTAPESFVGKITLYSDQYSLAIAYHELLTGAYPFDGKNFRQLAMQHSATPPNLSRLPEADRAIVGRALAKNPQERFSTCTEFIEALWAIPSPPRPSVRAPLIRPRAPVSPTPEELPVLASRETCVDPEPSASQTALVERRPAAGPAFSARPTPTTGNRGGLVPGYELLECISLASTGEVWKARSEKGTACLVKVSAAGDLAVHKGGPLDRLRSLRHPVLEKVEFVVLEGGRLAVISDPIEETLADRLVAYQIGTCHKKGLDGIPRAELLGYLTDVAECLDEVGDETRLRHLALTPRSLALTPEGVVVVDFGLAELVWLPGRLQLAALNPYYSAPELIAGRVAPTSDQYSLALIYLEMLTGAHPLRNLNSQQLASQKGFRPDLSRVPASDRPALLRALSVDSDRRFSSCTEFVQALVDASQDVDVPAGPRSRSEETQSTSATTQSTASLPQLNKLLGEVLARARGKFEVHTIGEARYLLHPGLKIEHQCHARLLPTAIKVQLHGFRKQWGAQLVSSETHSHVFQVKANDGVWNRLVGRTSILEVKICFLQPDGDLNVLTPMTIEIAPVCCSKERATELLQTTGPKLLESVRSYFQAQPERRRQERLRYDQSVPVASVLEDGSTGQRMTARAINISTGGMRLLLPCQPPTDDLFIELTTPARPADPVAMPARIVRAEACADGTYDVGVCFRLLVESVGQK